MIELNSETDFVAKNAEFQSVADQIVSAAASAKAAVFQVINADDAGEGFNDPTPSAPVPGNAGTTLGQQRLAADGAMFSAWLEAEAANDAELQAMLVRRFSPEYRTAFAAWLDTKPFTNSDAPPGPGYMPEYHNPQMEQAEQLNEHAATLEEAGTEARHTAEEYVRATVLFALVLFLVAVGQRFRLRGVRIATIAMAFGLLAYGLYNLATLPPI